MPALGDIWLAAFPPGGPYDAKGWVPRETVAARVGLFMALFLCIWCLLLILLQTGCARAGKIHGLSPKVWALKGMILFHHITSAAWAVSVIWADPVLCQILGFRGAKEEARRMLVVHPEPGTESAALLVPYTVAYMTTDLLLFPVWAKDSETVLFIFHHLFSMYFWSEGLRYDCGQRYALYLIGNELTGGPLILRWMLSQAGMKSSMIYALNGTVFTVLFLIVRVVPIPAIIRSTLLYFPLQEPWKMDPPSLYIQCLQVSGCLAIYLPLCLNLYWASKVVKGYMQAVKSFFGDGKPKSSKKGK